MRNHKMESEKSVLITGASTGIGKACALYLDKMGFKVFAGIRKDSDAIELKKLSTDRLQTILLDVTDSNLIADSLKTIEDETDGKFFGLVNNAGIGRSGVLEGVPVEEIRKVMEVNVIGLMAMTKAMIPILRRNKGRIINIGSTSSFLPFPGSTAYTASKFAVRALTDSLRMELKHFGMHVVLVAPGAVESEIWNKSKSFKEKLRGMISPDLIQNYSTLINFGDKLLEKVNPIPAEEVAKSVGQALTSPKPKRYYYVGQDAKAGALISRLPKGFTEYIISKKIEKIGSEGLK